MEPDLSLSNCSNALLNIATSAALRKLGRLPTSLSESPLSSALEAAPAADLTDSLSSAHRSGGSGCCLSCTRRTRCDPLTVFDPNVEEEDMDMLTEGRQTTD